MIIDIAIVLVLLLALLLGYQRGVIQPLMAEIFFFGTLLLVFRFHDTYTNEMQKYLHLNAVLSVFVALILAVIIGAIGGSIGGAFHRLEAIRGIDGLLGIFVHVAVTLVVVYLAVAALVTLDNAFEPTLKTATLTLAQVNQLENWILSNPITAAMVSKQDLAALKTAAASKHRFGRRHPPAPADLRRLPTAAAAQLESSAGDPFLRISHSGDRPRRTQRPEAGSHASAVAEGEPLTQPEALPLVEDRCSTWR